MHIHRIDLTIAVYGGMDLITKLQRSGISAPAMREGKRKRVYAVFIFKQLCAMMSDINDIENQEY